MNNFLSCSYPSKQVPHNLSFDGMDFPVYHLRLLSSREMKPVLTLSLGFKTILGLYDLFKEVIEFGGHQCRHLESTPVSHGLLQPARRKALNLDS